MVPCPEITPRCHVSSKPDTWTDLFIFDPTECLALSQWEIFNEFNEWVDLPNSAHTKQKCHGLCWTRAWQNLEESLEGFLLLV